MNVSNLLSEEQVDKFHNDGFLAIPSFYDRKKEIEPIQYAIYEIIGLLIKKYSLNIERKPFDPESFDSGYQEVIRHDRKIGGEIYDAVKQIPAFMRLVCNEKHDFLFSQLRGTNLPGIAGGGVGIRIDNPNEEKFRAGWHQDYPAQFRSLDGIVFWSPLVTMTEDIGPVQLSVGSHKDGLVPLYTSDVRNLEKSGAYGLTFKDEEEVISRYPLVAPLTSPGDLLLIDFLTVHASGFNKSERSRWSMQMRYFNYLEPTGIRIGWKGSFAAGNSIKEIHPELIVD